MNNQMLTLTSEQTQRYSRQLILPEVGEAGQLRLLQSSVVIVGAGGLGGPAALFLAGCGVGRLVLVDGDRIHLSNLGRQIIHQTEAIGQAKVASAARTLHGFNPHVRVETVDGWIDEENADALFSDADVVVDASDNFATRYLINATCHRLGKPLVTGAVLGFEGQVSVIRSGIHPRTPCYQCLYPHIPSPDEAPTCMTAGVLGPLVGVVGTLQACETIKILLNIGHVLDGEVLLINLLEGIFQRIRGRHNPECAICA
ncbi:MAG: HesA/MoeB/ThiF family protein [Magnetococcus sp. DMHC-6]